MPNIVMVPRVKAAIPLQPYTVRVVFADGEVRDVDMEPLLGGPVFQALRDPDVFASVEVDELGDTIVWSNGADIDPEVLYGSDEPASPPAPGITSPQLASPRP